MPSTFTRVNNSSSRSGPTAAARWIDRRDVAQVRREIGADARRRGGIRACAPAAPGRGRRDRRSDRRADWRRATAGAAARGSPIRRLRRRRFHRPWSIDWRSERRSPNGRRFSQPVQPLRIRSQRDHAHVAVARSREHGRSHARRRSRSPPSTGDRAQLRNRRSTPTRRRAFDDVVRAVQLIVSEATGISAAFTVPARRVDRRDLVAARRSPGLEPVLGALAGALAQHGRPTRMPNRGHPPRRDVSPEMLFGMMMQRCCSRARLGRVDDRRAVAPRARPVRPSAPARRSRRRSCSSCTTSTRSRRSGRCPIDELRYALALREVVHGAQRAVPWVRDRLVRLASAYVGAYEMQTDAIGEPTSAGSTRPIRRRWTRSQSFSDPDMLLGAMRTERQDPLLAELQRFVSVLEGYTDVVVEAIGERMVTVARPHRRSVAPAPARTRRRDRFRRPAARARARPRPLRHRRRVLPRRHGTQRRRVRPTQPALVGASRCCRPQPSSIAPGLWLARIDLPDDLRCEHRRSLGAGVMGGGIAQVCAIAGDDVVVLRHRAAPRSTTRAST